MSLNAQCLFEGLATLFSSLRASCSPVMRWQHSAARLDFMTSTPRSRCHYSMCASASGPIDTNCMLSIYINNEMDPYCIKRTLSRRKRGADDHSFDRLPWQFCLFPKLSAYLSHNVWLSCLFGDIHFKQNVKRIAKQRPSARPLVDPTLHIAYKVYTIPYWNGWYGNQTQAHLSNYFPQIPSRLATAQNIHFKGKPVQVKLHHDEDLPSSWRVLSHRTIEQYKQHQTKSKNIQPALTICNKSYQSSSYQPLLKVHTGNIKQQHI